MGNLCPWCKSTEESESTHNLYDGSAASNSQHSISNAEANDRTPLLIKSNNHHQYHQPMSPNPFNSSTTIEPSSFQTNIVPPLPPPPITNHNHNDSSAENDAPNETAETTMTTIVERMLPDLIDVSGWGTGVPQNNANSQTFNVQHDHLKQNLIKSLQSTRLLSLPDCGTTNLSALLSSRPISLEKCRFISHTANDLSRFLIDEIKIIHKEDLVVTFE